MVKLKTVASSILLALAFSAIQFLAAYNISMKILWQVSLIQLLAGPGPHTGHGANGRPMYEATPVHMIAAYAGLVLGVALYGVVFYFLLEKYRRKQSMQETC